ncbi:MAG: YbaB/EbfC family nucleoid-associated protein [Deltaproteobacteria bacterium]|nr:YbaB/EbfC family nucleoid-associated protein [Deltaproteobacteria bacterium]MBW2254057.1 YbaB/EbfC family nucleoid-associated protein [Deltaproteobacteria bacterium]
MSQFDLGGLGGLFAGLQQKVEDMKRWASETEVTGEAGGGLVKVTVTCDYQVTLVQIAEEATEDRELLEDLVRAAAGEALRLARDEAANRVKDLTGGLPLPPGLF